MSTSDEVDAYIGGFPPDTADALRKVRTAIHAAVPGASETIRYQMPAVMLGDRYLVHFAGWKRHVALYPVPPMPEPLESELSPLRSGKDTVKLMLDRPMPLDLVERISGVIAAQRSEHTAI